MMMDIDVGVYLEYNVKKKCLYANLFHLSFNFIGNPTFIIGGFLTMLINNFLK